MGLNLRICVEGCPRRQALTPVRMPVSIPAAWPRAPATSCSTPVLGTCSRLWSLSWVRWRRAFDGRAIPIRRRRPGAPFSLSLKISSLRIQPPAGVRHSEHRAVGISRAATSRRRFSRTYSGQTRFTSCSGPPLAGGSRHSQTCLPFEASAARRLIAAASAIRGRRVARRSRLVGDMGTAAGTLPGKPTVAGG